MIYIGIVGNCQMVSICFFLQKLLENKEYDIRWISYSDAFNIHLTQWSDKCKNKILNVHEGIEFIKKSDYILYQKIRKETSPYFNTEDLENYKKPTAKIFSISKIFVPFENYQESILKFKEVDENENNNIKVSKIIENIKNINIILINKYHPTTFLFLEIIKHICRHIDVDFFPPKVYHNLIRRPNIMGLSTAE